MKHPVIIRTSKKSGKFIGRCPACGKKDLSLAEINTECKTSDGVIDQPVMNNHREK